jgi:uncharacterized protein
VTRRLTIEWPDATPFVGRAGRPIRILAVSDEFDAALADARSRKAVGEVDLIVGCGDLDCGDLAFLVDGFDAPIEYVLGNHDAEERWQDCERFCPAAMPSPSVRRESGLAIAGLGWPGRRGRVISRSEFQGWTQALKLCLRRIGRRGPLIVITHAPPLGAGDTADGRYHRGFAGYRWLLERLRPRLWLHGHTPLAATREWHLDHGPTTVVNVTGAVVVELWPPGGRDTPA